MNEPIIREAMFVRPRPPRLPRLPGGYSHSPEEDMGEGVWRRAIQRMLMPRHS